jgi:hypothetical protein
MYEKLECLKIGVLSLVNDCTSGDETSTKSPPRCHMLTRVEVLDPHPACTVGFRISWCEPSTSLQLGAGTQGSDPALHQSTHQGEVFVRLNPGWRFDPGTESARGIF